jgi:hypothetical protein
MNDDLELKIIGLLQKILVELKKQSEYLESLKAAAEGR